MEGGVLAAQAARRPCRIHSSIHCPVSYREQAHQEQPANHHRVSLCLEFKAKILVSGFMLG
jgi:hypothetical protein